MKPSAVISVNAVLFIALGIGLTVYAPNLLSFFGVANLPEDYPLLYWTVAAFARMFGAVLLTLGLMLWGVHKLFQDGAEPAQARRDILFSLVLGFIILSVAALTQQSSVWGSVTGWLITGMFVIFAIFYIYFLARKQQ
jgi:hypothetical protein